MKAILLLFPCIFFPQARPEVAKEPIAAERARANRCMAKPAAAAEGPSGRVRLRRGVRLGRRVRQASQHGDQRPVVEDGEPFA